jgi:hypothetical protein
MPTVSGGSPIRPPQERAPTLLERVGSAAAELGRGTSRHPRAQAFVRAAVVVIIFGSLVGFIIAQWNKLPDYNWQFRPGWLGIAAISVALLYVGQGELWRAILADLGEHLDAPRARAIFGKSLLARYVPTSILMFVSRVMLAERQGVPRRVCLASMVYETGLAVCAAVIAGSYFVITLPSLANQPARFAILAVGFLALLGLHPKIFEQVANYTLRKLGRESLPTALPFSRVVLFCGLYLLTWVCVGFGVFAFASSLQPIPASDVLYVTAAYSVGFCVAVATFIGPGGLGVRDATLAAALAVVVPGAVAAAIAVSFRIFQTGIEVLYVVAVNALSRRVS